MDGEMSPLDGVGEYLACSLPELYVDMADIPFLQHLFSEAVNDDEVSSKEIKQILGDLIEAEDKKKPLSDDKLCAMLKEKGYDIARRTVAKYREALGIPIARLRKE